MFESDNYSEILLKEQEVIKLYGRRNLLEGTLVNLTDGGEGVLGQVVSDETRLKISKAGTGVKRSDEHKASISQANRDRIYTQEMRDKVSKKHKGKVISQEQREKLSKVSKGVKKSEEMKEKLRATRLAKGIHVLDLETGIEFDTLKIACEATNYRYGRALAQILYNYKVKRFIRVNDEIESTDKNN
jgi:hypothetical protein